MRKYVLPVFMAAFVASISQGFAQSFAQGSWVLISPIFQLNYETRLGAISCNLSRSNLGIAELANCAFGDGSKVPKDDMEKLGISDKSQDENK